MQLPPPRPIATSMHGGTIQLHSIMQPRVSMTPCGDTTPTIHLPPIHTCFDTNGTSSIQVPVSRRASMATSYSSDCSAYHLSRSSSPNTAFSPTSPETSEAAKITRRKRTDRRNFSRRNQDKVQTGKVTKDEGEAGRRYDHATLHAMMQHELLCVNKNLPRDAKQDGGKRKQGWTPLKSNNRSDDVLKDGYAPLSVNKENIYDSSCQVIHDSSDLLSSVSRYRSGEEMEAYELLQKGGNLPDDVKAFLSTIAYGRLSTRITTASNLRGSVHFSSNF